jgi:hypothetical protein
MGLTITMFNQKKTPRSSVLRKDHRAFLTRGRGFLPSLPGLSGTDVSNRSDESRGYRLGVPVELCFTGRLLFR